jgi:outer membrane protein
MYQSKVIMKAILACGIVTVIGFTSCDPKKSTNTGKTETKTVQTEAPTGSHAGRIAYVDMDTLQVKYEYLKTEKANLEKESAALEAELGRMAQNLQNEYAAFQKKAQAGTLSQAEGEAGQKKLQQMQQNMEERKQTAGAALMKKTDAFTKELQSKLDKYLLKYNADKHFDYILQYQKGGTILFANPELDITDDVAKGMNEEDKAGIAK